MAAAQSTSTATHLSRSLRIFLFHVNAPHGGQPLVVNILFRLVPLPQKPLVFTVSNISSFLLALTLAVSVR